MRKRIAKYLNVFSSDLAKYNESYGSGQAALINPLKKRIKELVIKGNSSQIAYSGYNLLDKSQQFNVNDVTVQSIDTGLKLTATASQKFVSAYVGRFPVQAGETYTVLSDVIAHPVGSSSIRSLLYVCMRDANGNEVNSVYAFVNEYGVVENSFVAAAGSVNVEIGIFLSYNRLVDVGDSADFTNLMLVHGSEKPSYEPYVGGAPSPSASFPQTVYTAAGFTLTASSIGGTETLTFPQSVTASGNTVSLDFAKVGSVADELFFSGGALTYKKRIEKIESYSGESVATDYISSKGGLITGATVYYVLPTERIIDLSSTSLYSSVSAFSLPENATVISAAGDIPVSYIKIKYSEKI